MKKFLFGIEMRELLNCTSMNRVDRLFSNAAPVDNKTFTYTQLDGLPEPVQRYLIYALPDGQPYLSYLRLQHSGTSKTGWGFACNLPDKFSRRYYACFQGT